MAAPPGSDPTITFLSGVTSDATVAPISFGSWFIQNPPPVPPQPITYDPNSSFTTKWGSTNLLPSGTPGGNVTYFIDPAWDSTAIDEWHSALALWSAVANITFTQVQNQASADFVLNKSNTSGTFQSFPNLRLQPSGIGNSFVSPPGANASITIGTDTAPLNGEFDTTGFQGGDSYYAIVHELGHLIGLGHSGPYNASDSPNDTSHVQAQFSQYDMQLWSMMSYVTPNDMNAPFFNQYPVEGTNWGRTSDNLARLPTTPMILDILAAQRLYGAATNGPLTTGNTTFGFNCNLTGDVKPFFDFTQNTHPVITVYDTGPNNTLDLSRFLGGATINLNPGSFTSAGQDSLGNAMVNNIGIAFGTQINNAFGTLSGFDLFIPNPALKGTLTAGGGTNTFRSTESGLSGDTLNNLQAARAAINFTDANPSTFSYTWNSTTLNYGGSALTTLVNGISSPIGRFIQTLDPTSGVDLTLGAADPLAHDFNFNHTSDILLQNDGTVANWMMSNGQFSTQNTLSTGAAGWSVVGTGDFTHNGTSDILLQNGGTVIDWLMQNGQYSSGNVVSTGAAGWSVVGTGDFNDDGTTDVLLQNGGTIVNWIMQDGLYSSGNVVSTGAAGWTVVGTGDFTGNGTSDVLLQNGGTVVDWIMQNGKYVGGNVLTTAAAGWKVGGTGDLLGNGPSDIVLQNGGTVVNWIMQNGQYAGGNVMSTGAAGWSVARVGDYNADGTSDLLLQNGGGDVVNWIVRNGQYASGNVVMTGLPAGWKIA